MEEQETEYDRRAKDLTHEQREALLDELDARLKLEAADLVFQGKNPENWIAHTRSLRDLILTHKQVGLCIRLDVAADNASLPEEVEDCTWQRCVICTPKKFRTLPHPTEVEKMQFGVAELLQGAMSMVLARVQWRGHEITITKHGKPVAKIVPIDA